MKIVTVKMVMFERKFILVHVYQYLLLIIFNCYKARETLGIEIHGSNISLELQRKR